MMLIGIMAGIVMPRIGGNSDRLQFTTAVKNVASLMRYARSQAVTQGQEYRLVYESLSNQMLVVSEDSVFIDPTENEPGNPASKKRAYDLPEGIVPELSTIDDRDNSAVLVRFYAMGNSSGNSLMLMGPGNLKETIDIDLITGAVRIVER